MTDLYDEMIMDVSRFCALAQVAEFGVADQLADGALDCREIAERCGAHPRGLAPILRIAVAHGVLTTGPDGRYALTEDGRRLRTGVRGSKRAALRVIAHPAFWHSLGNLSHAVRTGESGFADLFGTAFYDYLEAHPDALKLFQDYMTAQKTAISAVIADSYAFGRVAGIVDVGGGQGHILAGILRSHPRLRGVLFEREQVVSRAREFLAGEGVIDRCELVSGDFFAEVPYGHDVYLLANIIHNWGDEHALDILATVRKAMPGHARLLIVEQILPDDDTPHPALATAVRMIALFGDGAERTQAEYAELLSDAGFEIEGVTELTGGASLIAARPVDVARCTARASRA